MGRARTLLIALGWLVASSVAHAQTSEIAAKEAAMRSRPRELAGQRALGLVYLEAGRFKEAERTLSQALGQKPEDAETQLRLAQVRLAEGDFRRAKGLCKKIAAESKAPALGHLCLAHAYLTHQRGELALEEADAALALDANLHEAQLVRGHVLRTRGAVAEAEAAYAGAKAEPRWAAAAELGLGQLYAAAGRKDDAVAALRRALASSPHAPDALLALGRLLGSSEEARRLLAEALRERPHWAEAALALGDAQRLAGDGPGAEASYREALASDGSLAPALVGLGDVQLSAGRFVEARASYERALVLVPNDARAALALAEVHARTGALEEAIEQYRRASDLDPRNPAGLTRAAALLVSQDRTAVAAGYLDRVLSTHPKSGEALALYGDVMARRGDKVHARDYYERALATGEVDRARVESKLRGL